MFELFGKKKEKETAPQLPDTEREEFRKYAGRFQPEELDILAVTGANGFGGGRSRGEKLWTAIIGLTAWVEEGTEEVHKGEFSLSTLADDQLLEYLRSRVPRDFIIKCRARVSEDGKSLLLLDLPQPAFHPELKAVLEEQKKPVTFWEEGLGTFTLNRHVNWFEADVDWQGTTVSLSFDVDENRADCIHNAKTLLADAESWDRRVREYAAGELAGLAQEWAENTGDGEEEPEEVTPERFMDRITLESIQISEDGSFEFWFDDGWMFAGHSVHVCGDLEKGPDWAQMEG
ncbi:MAG: DUF2262 domain-containing protein [Lawsonibacter sp.]|nr:DUF2262 domain-containing protein [Lawsonibacter sp.]